MVGYRAAAKEAVAAAATEEACEAVQKGWEEGEAALKGVKREA